MFIQVKQVSRLAHCLSWYASCHIPQDRIKLEYSFKCLRVKPSKFRYSSLLLQVFQVVVSSHPSPLLESFTQVLFRSEEELTVGGEKIFAAEEEALCRLEESTNEEELINNTGMRIVTASWEATKDSVIHRSID